jgi:hypothetical protein
MSTLKKSTYLLLLFAPICATSADTIYKSIDKYGHVQYSTIAPDSGGTVENISPLPEPSVETIRAAQQSLQQFREKRVKRAQTRAEKNQSEPDASKKSNSTGEPARNRVPPINRLIAVTPYL